MAASPTTIQYVTLAAAILAALASPISSFMQARWLSRRSEKTKLVLSVHWKWFGPNQMVEEAPFLHIENRSGHTVYVNEVRYYWGVLSRNNRYSYTALWNEGPDDLNFPYEIKGGEAKSLMLSDDDVITIFRQLEARWDWLFRILKRFPVSVVIETTDRERVRMSAIEVMPWGSRPSWSKGQPDD